MRLPGKHKNQTIAFRPSQWEKKLIEERAYLSGLLKKDFITKSCIYSNIVVTGTKENIERITEELQVMESILIDIAEQQTLGNIKLDDTMLKDFTMEFQALILTCIDILKGAAYLFHRDIQGDEDRWKYIIGKKYATEHTGGEED